MEAIKRVMEVEALICALIISRATESSLSATTALSENRPSGGLHSQLANFDLLKRHAMVNESKLSIFLAHLRAMLKEFLDASKDIFYDETDNGLESRSISQQV